MPVWHSRSVLEQAGLTLRRWKVVELPDGALHLIGYCIENREGRVSSAVREFDYGKLIAKTDTGRVYVLQGEPGSDTHATYVWSRWATLNAVESWEDVSGSVWSRHEGESRTNAT